MSVRPIRIEGDLAYITLTKGYDAVIDATDVALVSKNNWCTAVRKTGFYVERSRKHGVYLLHRLLLGVPDGLEVDHINGNGLDNRRSNLRIATKSENMRNKGLTAANKSGIKGVSWDRARGKWTAHIQVNKKCIAIGRYETIDMAAVAYADAVEKLHGEFGRIA